MYLPLHTAFILIDLQDLLSQLSAPSAEKPQCQRHLCGTVDEDERRHILETLISGFNLVALNMGDDMHSCFGLAICNPVISLHLTWTLLDDICQSDHFSVCLSLQLSTFEEEHAPDWVLKDADWGLFSQLSETDAFPHSGLCGG
jgi:hypothetical protein